MLPLCSVHDIGLAPKDLITGTLSDCSRPESHQYPPLTPLPSAKTSSPSPPSEKLHTSNLSLPAKKPRATLAAKKNTGTRFQILPPCAGCSHAPRPGSTIAKVNSLLIGWLHRREEKHLLDVVRVRHEHDEAVNPQAPAAGRGQAVLERSQKVLVDEHGLVVALERRQTRHTGRHTTFSLQSSCGFRARSSKS